MRTANSKPRLQILNSDRQYPPVEPAELEKARVDLQETGQDDGLGGFRAIRNILTWYAIAGLVLLLVMVAT